MKRGLLGVIAVVTFLSGACLATAGARDCSPVGTGTPGYWMNHPEAWPVDEIPVGGQTYTRELAIEIMKLPVKGDKSLTMFAAYVAAWLNVEIGNCPPDCYTLNEVNTWLFNFPVFSGVKANSEAWQHSHGEALYWCLDDFNNGLLNSPSRDLFD